MAKETKKIINRVNLADVKGVTLTANRWTASSGSTYHSSYVSVLVAVSVANTLNANVYGRPEGEEIWIDLAEERFAYGYERQCEVTGYEIFREGVNGNFVDLDNVRVQYLQTACQMLMIPYSENIYDVKRQKDL